MGKQHDLALMDEKNNTVIFYPHVPKKAIANVSEVLNSRWIGQGAKVDLFERQFRKKFCRAGHPVAVNSGTSALHLAYILAGIQPGDEVIVPVFTCTATTIPLLWIEAKPVMADVNKNDLNINVEHVKSLITENTKAITCVHYGGLPCDMDELLSLNKIIIEDTAQGLGGKYDGDYLGTIGAFGCFSFQATKHITTGDGGMLVTHFDTDRDKAKRIRWFGIDREKKQKGIWENDIKEVGYKYQMTDISAAIGLEGLEEFETILDYRKYLLHLYESTLAFPVINSTDPRKENAAWLCTVLVEDRANLQRKLKEHKIESGTVHCRNDIYSIFGGRKDCFPNMDKVENNYLVLPLHTQMLPEDVINICKVINSGW